MLLIVFIAAYGVGSQAIINPYRQFNWDWESFDELLKGIFFLPYWQMYGELNLESVEVRDPDDKIILSKVYSSEGKWTFTSHTPGEHVVCLYTNSTKRFNF